MVDSNLLDDCFLEATQFVEEATAIGVVHFDENQKLTLYGLFKRATCGLVTTEQPSILHIRARRKWTAWKETSSLSETEAKERYITLVNEWCPGWQAPTGEGELAGPVFSRLIEELATEQDTSLSKELFQELRHCTNIEAMENVLTDKEKIIDTSERTPLHWAADEGCTEIAEVLVRSGYDINAQDSDLMTPLHYAVLCGHQELTYKLAELGARWDVEDATGETPQDLLPAGWVSKSE
eukprot:g1713.t1